MQQIAKIQLSGVNAYLVIGPAHRLLIDCGFPASLPETGRQLRPFGLKVRDIDHLIVTHFHIDHAGSIQEFKNEGAKFILIHEQREHIDAMEQMIAGKWPYQPLNRSDNVVMTAVNAGEYLRKIGIMADILHTPGHSPDSISILLDIGEVFTGDLPHPDMAGDNKVVLDSWHTIKQNGGRTVMPGHGEAFNL